MGDRLEAGLNRYWPVIFRGGLYFIIGFLSPLSEKLGPLFEKGEWPSAARTAGASLAGLISGALAIRAYFDGSAARHADELKKSDTQHFYKPSP